MIIYIAREGIDSGTPIEISMLVKAINEQVPPNQLNSPILLIGHGLLR